MNEAQTSQFDEITQLVISVRDNRNETDLRNLFRLISPKLNGYLKKRGIEDAQRDEILQDVFVTLWHKANQFDENRAPASAWIFRITHNKMIDHIRKDSYAIPEDLPILQQGLAESPEDTAAFHNELNALQDAMRRLKPDQRKMIETAYFGEKTHAEIQKETGLPLGTIKSRIRLGLEKLRHEMMALRK